MRNVLVPVDGSPASLRAVEYLIARIAKGDGLTVHLINVQPTLPQAVTDFIAAETIKDYRQDECDKALQAARALLEKSKIAHVSRLLVGDVAEAVAAYAKENDCEEIVMGIRGFSPIKNLLLGSSTTKLLHLAPTPITLVK